MHMTTGLATLLVLQCCDLCLTIRVPVVWDHGEVQQISNEEEFSVDAFKPQNAQHIPGEYFEYTAKKPQFAIDISASHGVKSPDNHYKAYPVRPHTGLQPPQLGIHQTLNENKQVFHPLQEYVKKEGQRHVTPASSSYEVFHPYKAEEPALQILYKDPVLSKIRNDLENSKNKLQKYENEPENANIQQNEYLESPKETDKKFIPQNNVPVQYENHRPQRRPIYYRPAVKFNPREQALNQKFRHPWNQNFVKVRPVHYRPLKNHIHNLRQHHAMTYDDERNEYPQIQVSQNVAEPQDGYDIYERGKDKYVQLRNNVDESINKAVQENRPTFNQNLELQKEDTNDNEDEEDEFVPIKNYAQVRKTETYKHLPRTAALEDAETYEEIKNAPRLREAVKSTKAQTVYTEEGYEDSAYDHAGEQKHASDHEGHGGYLKQKEISGGKYKTPSFSGSYDENKGSEYRDQVLHGEKWKNNNKDNEEETEVEDFSEDGQEQLVDVNSYKGKPNEENNRNKRQNDFNNDTESDSKIEKSKNETNLQHDVDKREANFNVPDINLNSTFLSEEEILKIAKQKIEPKKDNIMEKYPYYFNNIKSISKHSPLRYAENLKYIPNKSKGGTEFYDSRSNFECPEVEDVNPLPDKLKKGENPTSEDARDNIDETKTNKGEKGFDTAKEQPRLRGLGDKIDCFKAKYFGENPLDSPFFKEELILSPEPVTAPNLAAYKLKHPKEQSVQESITNNAFDVATNDEKNNSKTDIFILLDKLRTNQEKTSNAIKSQLITDSKLQQQSNVYNDILDNIKNYTEIPIHNNNNNISNVLLGSKKTGIIDNPAYNVFHDTENVTKYPTVHRKKRATPFIYEPYKIIRDGQVQDSKKTTTTSNISPLIKQMQSSRVVDRVTRANQEPDKQVKRYVSSRNYKDIGKNDRSKNSESVDGEPSESSFVDVNVDQRRGEPRYELRPLNHKPEYSPVINKTSMSVEDYKAQINNEKSDEKSSSQRPTPSRRNSRQRRPTFRPEFDVSKFLPTTTEGQNVAASNTIRKTISTTTLVPERKLSISGPIESSEDSESEEDYEEYDEDEEEEEITTTRTTTQKSTRKRRIKTPIEKLPEEKSSTSETPKLRLVTRFRDYHSANDDETNHATTEKANNLIKNKTHREGDDINSPKYREKKRKSTKSTLVTDTKKYGDDNDDDMREEEVDALIGVKQKMDDYIPKYEKHQNKHRDDQSSKEIDEDYDDDETYDDDNDDNDEELDEDDEDEDEDAELEVTTPEPTKRSLPRTTDAPVPTIASRSAKLELKPVISKKKVEIHNELPVNSSSPHVTQFKQDIKEVEIIKEMPPVPKKKQQKDKKALELYKDDSLAKDINNLGDVEIFMENLDLKNGPRHGGNYRMSVEDPVTATPSNVNKAPKDTEASQSENTKNIELDDYTPKRMHGGNLKSFSDISRSRNSGRNSKYVELSETEKPPRAMHGGNLRFDSKTRRGGRRNEKLIELDDRRNHDDDSSTESNYKTYSSRNGQAMHGGNYRSAKLIQSDNNNNENNEHDIRVKPDKVKDPRRSAAVLLNSFAQAVPILTTTPGYILDPSKRMYYYAET